MKPPADYSSNNLPAVQPGRVPPPLPKEQLKPIASRKRRSIRLYPVVLILVGLCIPARIVLAAADFSGADLTDAHLRHVDLRGADLTDANLTGADLSNSDLTAAKVTQPQLDKACGTQAKLPAGFTIKPCIPSLASERDSNGN